MTELTNIANLAYVEALYREYLTDPSAVAPEWQKYFAPCFERPGLSRPPRMGTYKSNCRRIKRL